MSVFQSLREVPNYSNGAAVNTIVKMYRNGYIVQGEACKGDSAK